MLEGSDKQKVRTNVSILEIEVFDYLCTQIYGIKPTPYDASINLYYLGAFESVEVPISHNKANAFYLYQYVPNVCYLLIGSIGLYL